MSTESALIRLPLMSQNSSRRWPRPTPAIRRRRSARPRPVQNHSCDLSPRLYRTTEWDLGQFRPLARKPRGSAWFVRVGSGQRDTWTTIEAIFGDQAALAGQLLAALGAGVDDGSHDRSHLLRVARNAIEIADAERELRPSSADGGSDPA